MRSEQRGRHSVQCEHRAVRVCWTFVHCFTGPDGRQETVRFHGHHIHMSAYMEMRLRKTSTRQDRNTSPGGFMIHRTLGWDLTNLHVNNNKAAGRSTAAAHHHHA